jgi:hypothetical protein
MSSALLSRFDLIYILVDRPDEMQDQLISEHILGTTNKNFDPTKKRSFGLMMEDPPTQQGGIPWDAEGLKDLTLVQKLRKQVLYVKQMQNKFNSQKQPKFQSQEVKPAVGAEGNNIGQDILQSAGSSKLRGLMGNNTTAEPLKETEETEEEVLARLWGSKSAGVLSSNSKSNSLQTRSRHDSTVGLTQRPTSPHSIQTQVLSTPSAAQYSKFSDSSATVSRSFLSNQDITLQTTVKKQYPPSISASSSSSSLPKTNSTNIFLKNSQFFDLIDTMDEEEDLEGFGVSSSLKSSNQSQPFPSVPTGGFLSRTTAASLPPSSFSQIGNASSNPKTSTSYSFNQEIPMTVNRIDILNAPKQPDNTPFSVFNTITVGSQKVPPQQATSTPKLSSQSQQNYVSLIDADENDDEFGEEFDTNDMWQLTSDQMKRYIEYAKVYCHPMLTKEAAKVLQRHYLLLRAQSSSGNSLPITTRNLESLIRLAQARARIELREQVTAADAEEVVQLLQESLLDVYTDERGIIDVTRRGGTSMNKQMKALVTMMNKEVVQKKGGNNIFTKQEIGEIVQRLQLNKEVDELIENMRRECYLLLKGPKLYQLQTME